MNFFFFFFFTVQLQKKDFSFFFLFFSFSSLLFSSLLFSLSLLFSSLLFSFSFSLLSSLFSLLFSYESMKKSERASRVRGERERDTERDPNEKISFSEDGTAPSFLFFGRKGGGLHRILLLLQFPSTLHSFGFHLSYHLSLSLSLSLSS